MDRRREEPAVGGGELNNPKMGEAGEPDVKIF
jgi:hypothetical protein